MSCGEEKAFRKGKFGWLGSTFAAAGAASGRGESCCTLTHRCRLAAREGAHACVCQGGWAGRGEFYGLCCEWGGGCQGGGSAVGFPKRVGFTGEGGCQGLSWLKVAAGISQVEEGMGKNEVLPGFFPGIEEGSFSVQYWGKGRGSGSRRFSGGTPGRGGGITFFFFRGFGAKCVRAQCLHKTF